MKNKLEILQAKTDVLADMSSDKSVQTLADIVSELIEIVKKDEENLGFSVVKNKK